MSHYNYRSKAYSRYAKGERERKHTTTENHQFIKKVREEENYTGITKQPFKTWY